ncbi:unnamed protein product [Closterium sp. Yama58-4]|nr:unnamed protein product [Closterium sp. Yama58-4]
MTRDATAGLAEQLPCALFRFCVILTNSRTILSLGAALLAKSYVWAMPAPEAQSQGAAERNGAGSDRVPSTIAATRPPPAAPAPSFASLLSLAAPKPLVSFLRSPLHAALLCLPVAAFLLLLLQQPVAVEHIAIHAVDEQYRLESLGEQKGSPASHESPATHEQLQRRVDELLASWAAHLAESPPTVADPVASDSEGSGQSVALPPTEFAGPPTELVPAPHLADCAANARVYAEEHWASRPADGSDPPWAAVRRYAGDGEGEGEGEREGEGEKGVGEEGGERESEIGGSSGGEVRREAAELGGEARRRGEAAVEGPFPPWVEGADADNYPLTRVVQRDLWRHQFPRNCSHPAVRFLLAPVGQSRRHGLGTQMTLLAGALAMAVRSGRVLVIAHTGARGKGRGGVGLVGGFERAEHEGCAREGMHGEWRCYFLPETSHQCRRRAHALAMHAASFQGAHPLLATPKHPSLAAPQPLQHAGSSGEDDGGEQGRVEEEGAEGEDAGGEESGGRQQRLTGLRASAAVTAGPSDSSSLWTIAPGPMERQLWWRVRVPWVPRALVSMHVRMGDKGREMRVAGAAEYVRLLLRVRRHDPHARFVWLATEMQPVVEQLSGMGGWTWFTTDVPRMAGNDSMPAYERALGVQRSTDNAFVNLLLAGEADYFIGALGSSWSFLLDALRCTAGKMRRGFLSVNVSPRW